jgi:hypothetical protein
MRGRSARWRRRNKQPEIPKSLKRYQGDSSGLHISTDTSESPPQRWPSNINTAALGNRANSRRNSLIIAALNLLLFIGACFWFSVQYQTNDDVGMNLYAAGKGLGQLPSEFLLFQHFLIGLPLKFLYTRLPAFPWYGTLTYLYFFVSSLTVGYVISRLSPRLSAVGLWLVVFVLFYLKVIVSPQFTICAGYLAIAGILLLFATTLKPYVTKKGNLYALTISSALLILAGLIRVYSLLLVLLLMSPLYGYALVSHSLGAFRRLVPVLCSVLLISALLQWRQQVYYEHSSGWAEFYRYNNVRADFIDRHKIVWNESTKPFFQQIGWSQNDLAMLVSWFYLDPRVYSLQKLSFISQHTSLSPRREVAWRKLLVNLTRSFLSYAGVATLALFALLLIMGVGITRGFSVVALLWCSSLVFGIEIIERHLPYRVWLVILFGLYTIQLTLWCQTSEKWLLRRFMNGRFTSRLPFAVVAIFYAICCGGEIKAVSELSITQQYLQKSFRDDMARLQPRGDQLFVIWGGDFPYEEYQLPTQAAPVTRNMQILGLGVGSHEPFVQNRLKSFGIDNLYQAFYTRDDVFLICNERKKRLLIQYIWEHYHTSVEIRTVFQGAKFTVRQVRKSI